MVRHPPVKRKKAGSIPAGDVCQFDRVVMCQLAKLSQACPTEVRVL